jgi:predicted Rossmann fold nucleotide-binding protein DprA/Smf involved in DNA uptake
MITHPAPENFPIRNRIVAGMPLGVIVVEGAQYSGSLITARLAMEFCREVFGVIDDIVERCGLNSSEVLATLFKLEMKGIVRQSPGKQFSKVLF